MDHELPEDRPVPADPDRPRDHPRDQPADRDESFGRWLRRPETMIGLAALLLSICGLFVSIYEAALVRRSQRAAVWPHLELGYSHNSEGVRLVARNSGVGPARVHAAALFLDGKLLSGWPELVSALGFDPRTLPRNYSLLGGRVLPAREEETIFQLPSGKTPDEARTALLRAITEQRLEVTACYCSVDDECRATALQDLLARLRGDPPPRHPPPRDSCDDAPSSGI